METLSLLAEFDTEIQKDIDKVNQLVVEFHADLKRVAPVDTGEFRDSWSVKPSGKLSWTIENKMEYASILWAGRVQGVSKLGNPQIRGSDQWAGGGEPMLARFKYKLKRALR